MWVISAFSQYFTVRASESSDNFYLPATFAWILRDLKHCDDTAASDNFQEAGNQLEILEQKLFINAALGGQIGG